MNIQLIAEQIGHIHLTLETQDAFEVYGGTALAPFEVSQTGTAQWTLTVREKTVVAAPLRQYNVYARQLATGREWEVLSGKILVSARTAAVPADKLAPVEYFVTVPVVDHDVDAVGSTIVQGIPGPQGPKGEKGDPGEGGMTAEERATLAGAAQRGGDNTFTASNTFTGEVDMSGAQVTPPSGWNVGGVTPEAIQKVAPIAWEANKTTATYGAEYDGFVVGQSSRAGYHSVALGDGCYNLNNSVVVGKYSFASNSNNQILVGRLVKGSASHVVAVGDSINAKGSASVTIGSAFEDTSGKFECTTQGTGSITIGAGANTLNNGDTESSNSVTIGCKASNKGADSVVIGAQSEGKAACSLVLGAGASSTQQFATSLGYNAKTDGRLALALGGNSAASGWYSTAVSSQSAATAQWALAVGYWAQARAERTTAIGAGASAADYGATVLRSTAEDGTYTQLYFSGANTPLANTYHGGAPMLGYVTKDSAGNIVAAGTRSLIDLLTDNSTFAPASLDENGEWVMPKVFYPSDLDLPVEEPSEPEEYQPLPVYPIVEPDELRTPTQEI